MREIEPHVGGVRALKVPSTGITDYAMVTAKYAELAAARGVVVKTGAGVMGFAKCARGSGRAHAGGRISRALCCELRGIV